MIFESEQDPQKAFPFRLITVARGDADSKTPVFERKDYEVYTLEFIERGQGFLQRLFLYARTGQRLYFIQAQFAPVQS